MKDQEQRQQFQLPTLTRSHFMEVEPCIKNAHTASHLTIVNNQLAFLVIEQALHVYSLAKMAERQASLINVISLNSLFQPYTKEHYEDLITSVFRKAEKQDFSSQIFNEDQDPKSNILLNIEHLKARLSFFNNSTIRVKSLQISESHSAILIVLHDGRGAVLRHSANSWADQKIDSVNLNDVTTEKIIQGCFLSEDWVCVSVKGRLLMVDLKEKQKVVSHKCLFEGVFRMKGKMLDKDRMRVFLVCEQEVVVCDMTKKKVSIVQRLKVQSFINSTFFFQSLIFVTTHHQIWKIDCQTIDQSLLHQFSEPSEVSHMDQFGNFAKTPLKNNREALSLIASTTNGVFLGLTIRRNGNYKEGRLLVFECPLTYYIQKLLCNVGHNNYIDTSDSIFIPKSKQNRQILQDFAGLYKRPQLIFNGVPLTLQDYNKVSINLGHAFQGKQIAKAKIIEKTLRNRFEPLLLPKKKLEYNQLVERCIFTGSVILEEEVVHCRECDIFGIEGKGDKCVVCLRKMVPYQ